MPSPVVAPAPRRAHYAALALFFITIAVYGSWVPFETITLSPDEAWEIIRAEPLIAFGRIDRSDWATNVLLFVPISFCLLGACSVDRRRPLIWFLSIPTILIGCLALSICLEVGQLWLPLRYYSNADIIAQCLGAMIGIGWWWYAGETVTTWLRTYSGQTGTRRQISWLLQAYLAGLVIYAVLPLNLTIHPEELYEKLVSNRFVLIPFSQTQWNWPTLGELSTDVLVFVPVGALATIGWLPPGRTLRSLPESIFVGAGIVLAVELCQLPVMSRFTDATDLITGTIGVAIGAAITHALMPRNQSAAAAYSGLRTWHWLLITGIYSLIIVIYFSLPFELIEDRTLVRDRFQQMLRVPGASLLAVSQFRALTEILRKTLLFLPLGAILARTVYYPTATRKTRWMLWTACLIYAMSLGMLIEVAQVPNSHHTPDASDALLCTMGAAIGLIVTARLLRHHHESA